MKRLALIPVLAALAVTAHAETFFDKARVSSVAPQYDNVTVPRQECSRQWERSEPRYEGGRDLGGAVLGGIVGGLIGNQVGGGHGREAATAVGAVVGAFTGSHIAQRDRWQRPVPAPREVTVCREVGEVQSRLVGYLVTYDYQGQQFTTMMPEDPGRHVKVRVSVDLVGR